MVPVEAIEKKIYMIRGQKVMLDRDLTELYGVETRSLNQAVRRNIQRFPDDFTIKLTRDEIRNISQIVISPGIKHAPNVFAFTEQGVAMLSCLLFSAYLSIYTVTICKLNDPGVYKIYFLLPVGSAYRKKDFFFINLKPWGVQD